MRTIWVAFVCRTPICPPGQEAERFLNGETVPHVTGECIGAWVDPVKAAEAIESALPRPRHALFWNDGGVWEGTGRGVLNRDGTIFGWVEPVTLERRQDDELGNRRRS